MKIILAVFIGGGLGSVLRFAIGKLVNQFNLSLAVGTFISNVLSCIILAIAIMTILKTSHHDKVWYSLIVIGFCGGLSTFSTFSYETFQMFKAGQYLWAVLNVFLSISLTVVLLFVLLKKVEL